MTALRQVTHPAVEYDESLSEIEISGSDLCLVFRPSVLQAAVNVWKSTRAKNGREKAHCHIVGF